MYSKWIGRSRGLALVAALAVSGLVGCGGRDSTAVQAPTLVQTEAVAHSFDEALAYARPNFNGHGGKMEFGRVASASYVETSVREARALVAPNKPGDLGQGITDDDPVWLIVAYGEFKPTSIGLTEVTPTVMTTAWVFVVEGTSHFKTGYNNARYDLSNLGETHDLDPVQLNFAD